MRKIIKRRSAVVIALCGAAVLMAGAGYAGAEQAAAEPPTTVEDCLELLQTLVDEAHAVDLLDDQIDHAENYVALMERSCLAADFPQAMAFAAEVRKILATNK